MKIDLYEYTKEIIKESDFDLEVSQIPKTLVDNDKKVSITRVSNNEVDIEIKDKYEGNFKKVELEKNKSGGLEILNIAILLRKATITYGVNIIISNDCFIRVVNSSRNMFVLTYNDNKIVINNYKALAKKVINPIDLSIESIIKEIGDVVHNAHSLVSWKKDVDELFNIIKPCIILGINSIVDEWEIDINDSKESMTNKIDDIDKQINMLKELREAYVSKISHLNILTDTIENKKTR